jgi:hypothetical protein
MLEHSVFIELDCDFIDHGLTPRNRDFVLKTRHSAYLLPLK